jgi:hypothetical protein
MQDSTGHPQPGKAIAVLSSSITYDVAAGRHYKDCEIVWMQPRGNETTAQDTSEHLMAKRVILDVVKVIAGNRRLGFFVYAAKHASSSAFVRRFFVHVAHLRSCVAQLGR